MTKKDARRGEDYDTTVKEGWTDIIIVVLIVFLTVKFLG